MRSYPRSREGGGRQLTSKRWLIGLSALVVMLTVAGAVSFVRYARRHRPDPQLAAIAPFDIFVPGLEPWRVRLAVGLTKQLDSLPPLAAVSQDVVRERWRGQARPELAALELARGTSADLETLPQALAQHVRQNYRYPRD